MVQMTRVLQFAVFAILGLVVPSPAMPTMTQNPCVSCQAGFYQYRQAIVTFNMSAIAAFMGELCDTTLPAVEQCLRDEQCTEESHTHWLALHNTFLCHRRADIQDGVECWAQEGLQRGMTECREALIEAGPSVPPCQGLNNMWKCMEDKMEQMQQCANEEQTRFVFDYMTFGAHQMCGDTLSHN